MKTTELVLDFLRKEGFAPEVDTDNGNLFFKFQMAGFLYVNNDEDKGFFQLLMPAIYDVTEDNRYAVLEAANEINTKMKVAKANIIGDSVWLACEILLDETPNVEDIMPRLLGILQTARQEFYQEMQG